MKISRFSRLLGSIFCFAISTSAIATNGIYLIGTGAKSRSMGGVGIGYTQDTLGNQMNPAGIANIDMDAMQADMSLMYFAPKATATIPDPRDPPNAGRPIEYDSHADQYLIPAVGGAYKFNRKVYMGFSFVGAGGGGTRYTRKSPLGYNFFNPAGRTDVGETLGIDYLQAQMAMTLAYKVNKQHAVAFSPVLGIARFRSFGLGVFKPFSSKPDKMTNNGNDYAYGGGVRFGWQGKLHKRVTLGAAYTSKIYFTEFEDYEGLFAEQGSLDNAANYGLGLSIALTDKLDLAFDWIRYKYGSVKAVANPIENLETTAGFLGEEEGAGFGWDDQDVYKVGLKYKYNKQFDFMLGYNYGEVPMPDSQLLFSAVAPAVTEHHATAGVNYKPNKNIELTMTYVHAFKNTERGLANSGGQFDQFFPNEDLTGPGDMELEMKQNSLELQFTYKM